VKRGERMQLHQPKSVATLQTTNPTPLEKQTASSPDKTSHIIKKGETLYQLSKRYGVSILDLLVWNPALVVDDIPLGASIRISAN
jgi:LysM repeat protein